MIPVTMWYSFFQLMLALPMITLSSSTDKKLIYVDSNSQTGVNDSSCWEGGYSTPCLSLNLALKGAQHYNHSITILLQPGQHQLHNGSETQLRNMSQLAIVGNASQGEPVVITCQPLTGLAFLWSTNITISNLSLINCGKIQSEHDNDCNPIQVAILFTGCSSTELSNLHVNESSGTGVAVYNAMDKVSIDSCQFMYGGGGGLVIEASEATSQSFCTITKSTFTHNTASSAAAGQWINPCGSTTRGGGISVVLRGEATNNTVQLVNSVRLNNNKAQFGGGLFLGFYDNASGNTVTVDNAEVTENEVLIEKASSASGGGIFIGFAATGTNGLFGNVVTINSSRIISNEADIGGGISVNLVHNAHECSTDSNELVIENSTFDSNTAFQGSSAYLSQSGKCNQPLLNTTVSNSSFTNGHCSTNQLALRCSGNVVIESMPLVIFHGFVVFMGDKENSYSFISALSLRSSFIELSSSAQLQFINNSAYNGAGIHLVGSSSIILNTGSTLLFKHNTASGQGGAIYADTCTLSQTGTCVFKHINSSLHPDDWGVKITFIDNQLANSIYIDTVKFFDDDPVLFNGTFCWKGWTYLTKLGVQQNCTKQLRSGSAAYINYESLTSIVYNEGIPLQSIVQYKIRDIWDNDITEPYKVRVELANGACPDTITSPGTLYSLILPNCSHDYTNQSSLLHVYPPQHPKFTVTILFEQCGDQYCVCMESAPSCFYCQTAGKYGACPTYAYPNRSCVQGREGVLCGDCSEGYAVAINDPDLSCIKCNYQYGVAIFLLLQLVPVLIMLTLLAVLHIKITDGNLSVFVLFSQIVTLQFPGLSYSSWILKYYNNSWLSRTTCSVAYYYRQYYLSIPLTVYSIWNLNFLNLDPVPFCIPHINTAAEAILLQYITAACPLVFIVVTYTWIKWYNNGYRLVVYTTRPVHQLLARFWQKFKIQPSLIDTYAGLILLSYMRFLATSAKLLKFTTVQNISTGEKYAAYYYDANLGYFGWPHAAYGVLAILCLLVFVVTPTIVLLFYHLISFQRCLTRCKLDRPGLHALVDAYQGCFKNSATDDSERRYFAGIILLFPIFYVTFIITQDAAAQVPFLVYKICLFFTILSIIAIFRPYKKTLHNFTCFMLVVAIAVITVYDVFFVFLRVPPYTQIMMLFIPFPIICFYLTYRLFKYCQQTICKNTRTTIPENVEQPSTVNVSVTTVSLDELIAEDLRMLIPDENNDHTI